MKAEVYSQIKTSVDLSVDFGDRIIPVGTVGTIVECYKQPEGYAVDLALPNDQLIGSYEYENVILQPDQFSVIQDDGSEATMPLESRA